MHVLYMSLQVLVCQSKLLVTKLKLEEQTKQSSSHPITTTMWCSIAPDRRKLSQTWTSAAHTRAHAHIHVLTKCIQTADLSLFLSHRHTLKLKPTHTHTHTHSFACIMFCGHPTHFISLTQIHLNGWYAHAHNDLSPLCSCCSHMLCTAKILQTLSPSAGHLTGIIWVWYLLSNYSISVISSCFERTIWENKCT